MAAISSFEFHVCFSLVKVLTGGTDLSASGNRPSDDTADAAIDDADDAAVVNDEDDEEEEEIFMDVVVIVVVSSAEEFFPFAFLRLDEGKEGDAPLLLSLLLFFKFGSSAVEEAAGAVVETDCFLEVSFLFRGGADDDGGGSGGGGGGGGGERGVEISFFATPTSSVFGSTAVATPILFGVDAPTVTTPPAIAIVSLDPLINIAASCPTTPMFGRLVFFLSAGKAGGLVDRIAKGSTSTLETAEADDALDAAGLAAAEAGGAVEAPSLSLSDVTAAAEVAKAAMGRKETPPPGSC